MTVQAWSRSMRGERTFLCYPTGMAGVSLIELLIALLVSAVTISTAIRAFAVYGQRFQAQQMAMNSTQELRLALDVLCNEVRMSGVGLLSRETAFSRMEGNEIEFLANLGGAWTKLSVEAGAGQRELTVEEAAGWAKGKLVLLCPAERCVENRVSAEGRKHELSVIAPLAQRLPVGTAVYLVNRVRYYLKRDDDGVSRLMRDVDGGVSTLLGGVMLVRFDYLNKEGVVTMDPRQVVLVRVTIAMEGNGPRLTRDVGLRV